jgi:hypothetical protein
MSSYTDQVEASSGAFNQLIRGACGARIYGELVTSAWFGDI